MLPIETINLLILADFAAIYCYFKNIGHKQFFHIVSGIISCFLSGLISIYMLTGITHEATTITDPYLSGFFAMLLLIMIVFTGGNIVAIIIDYLGEPERVAGNDMEVKNDGRY